MLEPIAPQQTRFVTPGLFADPRGVALGRFVAVLLPSIDRVVGLFRALSETTSLDELLGSLRIVQVRTPLSSREFIVQIPASSSHVADCIAGVAVLIGGLTFTGSAKHFVRYRDRRAPLGYDTDALYAGAGDLVLYGADFVQTYEAERELAFAQLAFNLQLEVARGDVVQATDQIVLRVVLGLWPAVLGYLHRNNVTASACAVENGAGERFYLIRCPQLPPRMTALFRQTPGLEVLRMHKDNVGVELGYRHPFEVSSCASVFDERRTFLFAGRRGQLDIIEAPPQWVSAARLVGLGSAAAPTQVRLRTGDVEPVRVPLKLVASFSHQTVVGARLPLQQAEWLKKLVYVLPPPVLAGCEICVGAEHIYLRQASLESIPLGELYYAAAPNVLVPLGLQLVPRVAPEVLLAQLNAGDDVFYFVREPAAVVRVARSGFQPLSRAVLAEVDTTAELGQLGQPQRSTETVEIVHQPLGLFPLRGFHAEGD